MQRNIFLGIGIGVMVVLAAAAIMMNRSNAVGFAGPEGGDAAFLRQFNTDNLTIPREEMLRGGPEKDGIPAITDPDLASIDEVDFLNPDDRVVGVTIEGESRAYPLRLLNWHEAVNDQIGDTHFAVLYCPLCDSASVADRRMGDEVLEFGISGLLYSSNVLLYDRTHDALWSQIEFEAVSGPYAGQPLKHLPFELTTFGQWRKAHPDSLVATFNTGHRRAYNRNPYEQYFEQEGLMFPAKGGDDDRLPQKEPVVGVQVGDFARAYPVEVVASPLATFPGTAPFFPRARQTQVCSRALVTGRVHPRLAEPPANARPYASGVRARPFRRAGGARRGLHTRVLCRSLGVEHHSRESRAEVPQPKAPCASAALTQQHSATANSIGTGERLKCPLDPIRRTDAVASGQQGPVRLAVVGTHRVQVDNPPLFVLDTMRVWAGDACPCRS